MPYKTALDWMREQVDNHVVEDAGYNMDHGGTINNILRWLKLPLRSSYCAAAVCYSFAQAGAGAQFPETGGSQAIKAWARKNGRLFTDPQHLLNCKGAVAGWTNVSNPGTGHVFLVEKRLTDLNGRVIAIGTLEANTGPDETTPEKDRDGGGFYRRKRNVQPNGNIWFVDTTGIKGGEYW